MPHHSSPEPDAIPHSSSLRLWRQDLAACTYFVRACTADRAPLLACDEAASVVVQALRFAHHSGWLTIYGYVVMPDHWHALWKLSDSRTLAGVIQSIKRQTARQVNALVQRAGPVWQGGYYEHAVRSQQELDDCLNYMALNPVRAGLAARPGDYRWASIAGLRDR